MILNSETVTPYLDTQFRNSFGRSKGVWIRVIYCKLHPEYGARMGPWNAAILQQNYTASQPRIFRLEKSCHLLPNTDIRE